MAKRQATLLDFGVKSSKQDETLEAPLDQLQTKQAYRPLPACPAVGESGLKAITFSYDIRLVGREFASRLAMRKVIVASMAVGFGSVEFGSTKNYY